MVYGKCEMMAEYASYGVLYLAEAIIAWLYWDMLFQRNGSRLKAVFSFSAGYLVLFSITWFDHVVLNGTAFFLINFLLSWSNFECKWKSSMLHSAFLTSIMAITEIIALFFDNNYCHEILHV